MGDFSLDVDYCPDKNIGHIFYVHVTGQGTY
jgi:hypothetical protein